MRRSLVDELGGYDPDLPHSADMYLWLRAAAHSDIGRVNGPIQAYYRGHAANMHDMDFGGLLDDCREVLATFDRFLDVDGTGCRDPDAAAPHRPSGGREGGAPAPRSCCTTPRALTSASSSTSRVRRPQRQLPPLRLRPGRDVGLFLFSGRPRGSSGTAISAN